MSHQRADGFRGFLIEPRTTRTFLSVTTLNDELKAIIPMKTVQIFKPEWYDLIGQDKHSFKDKSVSLTLKPYDVVWLEPQ